MAPHVWEWDTEFLTSVPQQREPGAGVPGAEVVSHGRPAGVLVLAPLQSDSDVPRMVARKESGDGVLTVSGHRRDGTARPPTD
jgi:hypothetical protein